MALGLIPWRGIRRSAEREASVTRGRWWWVMLWIVVPSAALALTWIPPESPWFDRVWQGFNPKPLWEPRYLGIIVPAWLLWLGAALRRMPTVWIRGALIMAVAGVCGFSALSNHLIYRNTPYHRAAAILEEYIDPKNREAAAVAVPLVKYPEPAENTATTVARRLVPGSAEDLAYVPYGRGDRLPWMWPPNLQTANQVVAWVRSAVANNGNLKVLVLTDRYGDLEDKDNPLSDEALGRLLGPRWELVREEKYAWHYEWRFYIFHVWRTRVWRVKA